MMQKRGFYKKAMTYKFLVMILLALILGFFLFVVVKRLAENVP